MALQGPNAWGAQGILGAPGDPRGRPGGAQEKRQGSPGDAEEALGGVRVAIWGAPQGMTPEAPGERLGRPRGLEGAKDP